MTLTSNQQALGLLLASVAAVGLGLASSALATPLYLAAGVGLLLAFALAMRGQPPQRRATFEVALLLCYAVALVAYFALGMAAGGDAGHHMH